VKKRQLLIGGNTTSNMPPTEVNDSLSKTLSGFRHN
jgi:hypothetical protein